MKRNQLLPSWVVWGIAILLVYLMAAHVVFAIRAPELTDTQRLLQTHRLLLFQEPEVE